MVPFYVISAVSLALMVLNLALANLGRYFSCLWELGLPAGIFASVVEKFRPGARLDLSTASMGRTRQTASGAFSAGEMKTLSFPLSSFSQVPQWVVH